MIRHVIFDMDGTLSDTAAATVLSCAEVARRYGLEPPGLDALRSAMGWPAPLFWRLLWPELSDALLEELDPVAEALESHAIRKMGPAILFPGIRELLDALLDRGFGLHIASTGSPAHVEATLGAAGIWPLFHSISCGESDKTGMVSRILRAHPGAGAVMVGDKQKDADAGRGNGIETVGAGWGYCGPAERPLFGHVLETPGQLLEFLR